MNQPNPALFREEALKHYLEAQEGGGLIKVSPPWTWALLWIFLSAIATALLVAFVGNVEVNARGRGIVRPATGVRMLISQSSGIVSKVEVRSSQVVKAGAVLIHIETPSIQGQFLEAERQTVAVKKDFQAMIRKQDVTFREQSQRLKARINQLQGQSTSYHESIQLFIRKFQAKKNLHKDGLVSSFEVEDAEEAVAQAKRQLSGSQQALDQLRQEQAAFDSRRQDELWQRKQVIQTSESKRDSLGIVLDQTIMKASENGVIEGLLVKPGEVIQAGQIIGKLIPLVAPLQVVSFLAEKDRAFVKAGDEVHLELEQLPYSEFGTIRAKIVRITDDLASSFEIREALGDDQKLDSPVYRVELEITNAKILDSAQVRLRTGMLMNVRYTLRRQRLITLILDPLRRWFR